MSDIELIAQALYATYSLAWSQRISRASPKWDQLPLSTKQAWRAVAETVELKKQPAFAETNEG